ncbi:MAG: hypothetical protein JRH15_20955 [Deltaproteobacteria bacterium]|nr:hypothetical protein [Deltaproteobacteria bacterium]
MKEMRPKERIMAALDRKPVDRIPYCEHLVDPGVAVKSFSASEKAGFIESMCRRLGWNEKEFRENIPMGKKAIQNDGDDTPFFTAEQSMTSMRVQGAMEPTLSKILNRDNITCWAAAGCFDNFQFYLLNPEEKDKGWSADGIIKTRDDLDKMKFANIDEVITMCEEFLKYKGDFAACAMIFLGIDPTWHTMGFETFSMALVTDPDFVEEVLGRITDWYAKVAVELCKLDFDFIWAADDIAFHTSTFFSPKTYRDVLLPHTRKVAEKITKPWIYHSDGNLMPIMDDLLSQGMNALHPLEHGSIDLEKLKSEYGKKVTLVGNIDLGVLEAGTAQQVEDNVKEKIRILGPDYGYMLCSSNSITPNVDPKNLRVMLDTLAKHGKYPLLCGK